MLIALHNLQPCLFCGIGWKEVEHTTRLQPDALASDLSSVYLLGKNSSLCRLDSNTPTITYKGIWFEIPMHTQVHVFDLKYLLQKEVTVYASVHQKIFHTFIWRGWNGANASRYGKSGSVTIILSDNLHLISKNFMRFKHKIIFWYYSYWGKTGVKNIKKFDLKKMCM